MIVLLISNHTFTVVFFFFTLFNLLNSKLDKYAFLENRSFKALESYIGMDAFLFITLLVFGCGRADLYISLLSWRLKGRKEIQ